MGREEESKMPAWPVERSKPAEGKNHNLPYASIGELFTGREEILEELRAQVAGEKATAITQAIAGLGGIGKSRLAVEFGWWGLNNEKYGHVFFVSSETPELLNRRCEGRNSTRNGAGMVRPERWMADDNR